MPLAAIAACALFRIIEPFGPLSRAETASAWALVISFALNGIFILRARDSDRESRRRAEAEREAESKLALTLGSMRDGIAAFDARQRLVVCNSRYQDIYALPDALVQPGTPFADIIDTLRQRHSAIPPTAEFIRNFLIRLGEGDQTPILVKMPDLVVAVSYRPRPGGGWVSTHEDVTERSRMEKRLSHLALHDPLTDLANRVLLREQLEQALAQVRRGGSLAVLCLDLDRFKIVNDTLGHPIGDALLKQVAQRLRDCVRESDVVARMGGDEFAIVQLGPQPTSATILAARIVEVLTAPFKINEHHISIGTSIGIAIAPGDGLDLDQLLKHADLALYLAKSDGRGVYRFFQKEMDRRMHDRRQLELEMREAIVRGQFELHYQPIFDLQSNEVKGLEALIRWNHPVRGQLPPADFLLLAEETGLIAPIGEWVLRQACAEAARWPDHVRIAVNVSPVQFKRHNLVKAVLGALSASNIAPHRLELELPETILLQDSQTTLATLLQLRDLGVGIAIEDFGMGYSSLSHFRRLPFDTIKIDRSFIQNLTEDSTSLAVLRAIAGLAVNLKVTTTAEGVETEDQLERVRGEGIAQVQGYLIGPPCPARDVEQMLVPQNATRAAG